MELRGRIIGTRRATTPSSARVAKPARLVPRPPHLLAFAIRVPLLGVARAHHRNEACHNSKSASHRPAGPQVARHHVLCRTPRQRPLSLPHCLRLWIALSSWESLQRKQWHTRGRLTNPSDTTSFGRTPRQRPLSLPHCLRLWKALCSMGITAIASSGTRRRVARKKWKIQKPGYSILGFPRGG